MRRTTQKDFIQRAKENYPNYDYSITKYNGLKYKVDAICPEHGKFSWYPDYFLHTKFREPCIKCFMNHKIGNCGIKYEAEQIITKLKIHTMDFIIENLNELENNKNLRIDDYAILKCKTCGLTLKKKLMYLINHDYFCTACAKQKRTLNLAIKKMNIFLEKAKSLYPQYNYSEVTPDMSKKRPESYYIICPKHGKQMVHPNSFYRTGCPRCDDENIKYKMVNRQYSNDEFINELKTIYGDLYDYSKVNYKNYKTKVLLICPKHGEFLREPFRLLKEHRGCPYCKKSLLEKEMMKFLNDNNIKFISEYHIGLKRLDFYLPDYNIGIECQGKQHLKLDSIFNTHITSIDELYQYDIDKLNLAKSVGITNILYFSHYKVDDYFEQLFNNKNDLLNEIYKYEKRLL